jgi:hypothetical protein
MSNTISTTDVRHASLELAGMKRSLTHWLKFRTLNDGVLAGSVKARKPLAYGQRVIMGSRDISLEQDIATQLTSLLSTVMPDAQLPDPNVSVNPNAAVDLARVAIAGQSSSAASPTAQGAFPGMSHPWLWPVLIVGGLLLAVTTAIKSAADVAKDQEEKACIEAGACTDYGFWLKAGGAIVVMWFVWQQLGVGGIVRGAIAKRRSDRK